MRAMCTSRDRPVLEVLDFALDELSSEPRVGPTWRTLSFDLVVLETPKVKNYRLFLAYAFLRFLRPAIYAAWYRVLFGPDRWTPWYRPHPPLWASLLPQTGSHVEIPVAAIVNIRLLSG